MFIKWESTVKGNAENPDQIGNLDKGLGDIDSGGERWVVPNTIASDMYGFSANP